MTFQAFRGSSGAHIAFTILLATSIGDRVTQNTAHERGGRQRSKSFFLENKVVINFNFRHGAKKSGHLDHLLQSYGQIYFNIFWYILQKAGWLWLATSYIKKIIYDMTLAIPGQWGESRWTPEPPQKKVYFRKWYFSGTQAFPRSFWSPRPWKPCVSASK